MQKEKKEAGKTDNEAVSFAMHSAHMKQEGETALAILGDGVFERTIRNAWQRALPRGNIARQLLSTTLLRAHDAQPQWPNGAVTWLNKGTPAIANRQHLLNSGVIPNF